MSQKRKKMEYMPSATPHRRHRPRRDLKLTVSTVDPLLSQNVTRDRGRVPSAFQQLKDEVQNFSHSAVEFGGLVADLKPPINIGEVQKQFGGQNGGHNVTANLGQ